LTHKINATKKQYDPSYVVAFWLIQHSNGSAILSKIQTATLRVYGKTGMNFESGMRLAETYFCDQNFHRINGTFDK